MKKKISYPLFLSFAAMATALITTNSHAQNTFPSSGNVGIGITTPSNNLQIEHVTQLGTGGSFLSGNFPTLKIEDNVYTNTTGLSPAYSSYNTFEIWRNQIFSSYPPPPPGTPVTSNSLAFFVTNTYNGAQVGINKSSATATLDVGGAVNADGDLTVAGTGHFNNVVVIGSSLSTPTGYNLYVANGILTEKVKVAISTTTDWSDYVFSSNYKLLSLNDLKKYIGINKHLPNIPSAENVTKDGVDLGKMDAKLLQKIEELTLYVITEKEEIEQLKAEVKNFKTTSNSPKQ